jgi:Arc/MetJ-type ribon-helix-helix transcriptional regulator
MFNKVSYNPVVVMSRRGYRSLTIPEGLYKKIEKYIDKSNGSYVSISEVVREALREYLKKNNS